MDSAAVFGGQSLDEVLMHAPQVTMEELLRATARLPLDARDHDQIVQGFTLRMKAGQRLSTMPLHTDLQYADRETKREFVQGLSQRGVALITSLDLRASLLIVKTDAGRGFFGGQKAAFTCFTTEGGDGFEPAGVVPTIGKAFGILDSMYRITAAAEQAFG